MKLGSKEHRQQFFKDLIKTYHENIWTDEINIYRLEVEKVDKQKAIKEIETKLEAKEYETANEGNKAKFVAEREMEHLGQKMTELDNQIKLWLERIEFVKVVQKSDKQK